MTYGIRVKKTKIVWQGEPVWSIVTEADRSITRHFALQSDVLETVRYLIKEMVFSQA